MNVIDLIVACAKVPSFSSYEERIHPLIRKIVAKVPGVQTIVVPRNNLILYVPGKRQAPPVAITAHIDKIDHFSPNVPDELPVSVIGGRIIGQMDDTAGVGIALHLMFRSREQNFPPLYIFLSEMEEGTGIRKTPDLLRNNGIGYKSGMGARNIAQFLLDEKYELPHSILTIDTSPKFMGNPGIAIYNKFWHRDLKFKASESLQEMTDDIVSFLQNQEDDILISNAYNDYIDYGLTLNTKQDKQEIPSIAIEPSIYPYHQKNEGVYCQDIQAISDMIANYLEQYDFNR